MKNILKMAGVVAVALALTSTLQATNITGNIGFVGSVTFDTGSAGTATEVTSWINPQVSPSVPTGSFASILPGTSAIFTGSTWTFADATTINPFWTVGGFTFELLSSHVVSQGVTTLGQDGFVIVQGTGIVMAAGFTPTTMSWSLTTQDPKAGTNPDSWSFSASANSVPDGGATVMLLGMALSGVALLRRKLTA
jgi:hypothetical protein